MRAMSFLNLPITVAVVLLLGQGNAVSSFITTTPSTTIQKSSHALTGNDTIEHMAVHPRDVSSKVTLETNPLSSVGETIESWLQGFRKAPATTARAAALFFSSIILLTPTTAIADEYGRETEAPTLFTGETVLICTKRGPLGACLKTEARTADNDNDKSNKYMPSPEAEAVVRSREQALQAVASQEAGSDLLAKLRQQTIDNKEKNDKLVKQKTIQNNQAASFGPFDRQVVVLNVDGEGYTLLENPQAIRLKKQGYINNNRQFIKQPSEEVLQAAMEPGEDEGFAGLAKAIFGGGEKE